MLNRRGLLTGLISLVAAPAIVRIDNLMPVRSFIEPVYGPKGLLTIQMITREAVRLWKNSNAFITNIDAQWEQEFGSTYGHRIGQQLRIQLPNEYLL